MVAASNPLADIVVVYNPQSSAANETRLRTAMAAAFGERRVDFCECSPQADMQARLAPWLDNNVRMVIAAGGDGTISDVADALVGRDVVLGILPQGTSNVLARELRLPLGMDAAARMLAGEHSTRTIDILRAGDSVCVLGVSVGLSALAMKDTGRGQKRLLGPWSYWLTFARHFFSLRSHLFTVELDGYATQLMATDVLAMNVGTIAFRAIRWGPEVKPDDGLLDFCFLWARNGVEYAATILGFALRRYIRNERVNVVPLARTLRIVSPVGMLVQGDGDVIGETPITISLEKDALRIAVPHHAQ
ncbi:MAG TPA: diacylglycerol kinase family protein [Anaerolineales bacterium]|nr:diacylglycerol kinase family protein [Anaerolineales bacterium]HRQ93277.1 diacylglycerol kinase family protein [Anaerolineales bacterium]